MKSTKVQKFLQEKGQRFFAILGMLGSDGDGERANAAALASKMLKEAELSWLEISGSFGGPAPSAKPQQEYYERMIMSHLVKIRTLENTVATLKRQLESAEKKRTEGSSQRAKGKIRTFNAALNDIADQIESRLDLSEREEDFILSIRRRNTLTDKQMWWLRRIAEQAGVPLDELD